MTKKISDSEKHFKEVERFCKCELHESIQNGVTSGYFFRTNKGMFKIITIVKHGYDKIVYFQSLSNNIIHARCMCSLCNENIIPFLSQIGD